MRYRDKIIRYFDGLPMGSVVSANLLYEKEFSRMTEAAFFKTMERLAKDGILKRMGKGLYAAADADDRSRDDENPCSKGLDSRSRDDEDASGKGLDSGSRNDENACSKGLDSKNTELMLNYFFGENNDNGMYIGQKLYVKYGITDVTSDDIMLYSNIISKATCNVGNIHVKRVDVELTYENTKIIEALEIMQNFDSIEGLNKARFARFAKQFSKVYNDEAAVYVITHMKYKKSTIAFMKKVLDMYKVPHSLQQFLSHSSKYKVPPVQRVSR